MAPVTTEFTDFELTMLDMLVENEMDDCAPELVVIYEAILFKIIAQSQNQFTAFARKTGETGFRIKPKL